MVALSAAMAEGRRDDDDRRNSSKTHLSDRDDNETSDDAYESDDHDASDERFESDDRGSSSSVAPALSKNDLPELRSATCSVKLVHNQDQGWLLRGNEL